MIGKISKGKDFFGVLAYAAGETAKDQHASLLDQNIATHPTTENLARAFDDRLHLGKTTIPVLHFSLAPTKKDWQQFKENPDKARAIIDEYMELMGLDSNHPRAVYQHNEKDGSGHFHIITTNILDSGKLWKSSKDHQRSMQACRTLETRYGLELVSSKPAEKRRASKNEVEKYNRTGGISPFEHIQTSIDDILQNGLISQTEFARQLNKAGIDVRFNQGSNGLNGASFSYDGVAYKGSKFGKAYTGKGLEARGLVSDEAFTLFKDDFKAIGQPVFEPKPSQILKARTPNPSHTTQAPKPQAIKSRSVEADVRKVVKEIANEFFGTGKDKQLTLDKQAEQALQKADGKHSSDHIQKAIEKIASTHEIHGKALSKAQERIEFKRGKDTTPGPFFVASSHSSSIEVPKLTPQAFNAKKQEQDRDASLNDDGSLYKSWDQMSEREKNEYVRRKNVSKPSYRPSR